MNQDQIKTFVEVRQILRMASQSSNAEDVIAGKGHDVIQSPEESPFSRLLKEKISNKTVGEVLSKSIFGLGMIFVAVFTSVIATFMPVSEDKWMFIGIAVICLIIGIYQLDGATRWIREIAKASTARPK